jgi:hypothetical protein
MVIRINNSIFLGLIIIVFCRCIQDTQNRFSEPNSVYCKQIEARQIDNSLYQKIQEKLLPFVNLEEFEIKDFEYCYLIDEKVVNEDTHFKFTTQLKIDDIEFLSIKNESENLIEYSKKLNGKAIKLFDYFDGFSAEMESNLNIQIDYSNSLLFKAKNHLIILSKSNQWTGIMAKDFYIELVDLKQSKIIKGYLEIN